MVFRRMPLVLIFHVSYEHDAAPITLEKIGRTSAICLEMDGTKGLWWVDWSEAGSTSREAETTPKSEAAIIKAGLLQFLSPGSPRTGFWDSGWFWANLNPNLRAPSPNCPGNFGGCWQAFCAPEMALSTR